jgi:hypothetical protein
VVWGDEVEPFASEQVAVVGDFPVAVQQALAFCCWQVGEGGRVVGVEVGVVREAGGEKERAGFSAGGVDEALFDPV